MNRPRKISNPIKMSVAALDDFYDEVNQRLQRKAKKFSEYRFSLMEKSDKPNRRLRRRRLHKDTYP